MQQPIAGRSDEYVGAKDSVAILIVLGCKRGPGAYMGGFGGARRQ